MASGDDRVGFEWSGPSSNHPGESDDYGCGGCSPSDAGNAVLVGWTTNSWFDRSCVATHGWVSSGRFDGPSVATEWSRPERGEGRGHLTGGSGPRRDFAPALETGLIWGCVDNRSAYGIEIEELVDRSDLDGLAGRPHSDPGQDMMRPKLVTTRLIDGDRKVACRSPESRLLH